MKIKIKKIGGSAVVALVALLNLTPSVAQETQWVRIDGTVMLADGTPICAMVLANGQYMFSCDGTGAYDMTLPLDSEGQVSLFAFADGFAPFGVSVGPNSFPLDVEMQRAAPNSPFIGMTESMECVTESQVRIHGTVESGGNDPLCALVLANGQAMFTCGESLGRYDLTVPISETGDVTFFGFADGFQPYRETVSASGCYGDQVMLALINAARAQGRDCGYEGYFPAAQPLTWNDLLAEAAARHSSDMAANNFFDHTGSDGTTVSDRVTDTGYDWFTVGENIAAGYPTEASAVEGLLDSPGHCANIMNSSFEEFGAALSTNADTDYDYYWTQVFGTSW